MGGRESRRKGHDFERKVARDLREIWPEAKRGYQTRGGGAEAPDIDGTPFHFECKVGKKPNVLGALRQAIDDSDGRPPVAVVRWDRAETIVAMRYEDWLDIMRSRNGQAE